MWVELLRRILSDWPLHFICSGSLGLLVYSSMETTLYALYSKAIPSTPGAFLSTVADLSIGLASTSVGIFVALLLHYILDYYVRFAIF